MRYMATVLDKASPIQQRTDPSEDLRTIISRAFLFAQTAANMGGSVSVDVWEESGDASKNPWAKIGQVAVNFARVPSLLLRSPLEASSATLALGNGKPAAGAPPRVACPYCDGVMDLKEDLNGIRYDYACAVCQWESSYSPSQADGWLGRFPIRSDGGRLAVPATKAGDGIKRAVPLSSFRDKDGKTCLLCYIEAYSNYLKVYDGLTGKELVSIACRSLDKESLARAIAKTFLRDKDDVEHHHPKMAGAPCESYWAAPPPTLTADTDLVSCLLSGENYGNRQIELMDGKSVASWGRPQVNEDARTVVLDRSKAIPLDQVGQVRMDRASMLYGPGGDIIVWQRPTWSPDLGKSKKGKGKKTETAAPAASEPVHINDSVAYSLRIGVLEEWLEIYNNDTNQSAAADELNDKTVGRTDALYALMEDQQPQEEVPADDEDLLGAWRALYPERALRETVRSMRPEDHEDLDSSCCREA